MVFVLSSAGNVRLKFLIYGTFTTYATLQLTEVTVGSENHHDVVAHNRSGEVGSNGSELARLGNLRHLDIAARFDAVGNARLGVSNVRDVGERTGRGCDMPEAIFCRRPYR